jgi:hypothetical protein
MIPIYIYCTKAKPYLLEDKIYHSGLHIVTPLFGWGGEKNGLIVARCEAKEAFVIKCLGMNMSTGRTEYRCFADAEYIMDGTRLTQKEICDYAGGEDIYAIHLENVTPCDLNLSEFYSDICCTKGIKRAPQSYFKCYHKVPTTCGYEVEKCYLFSIRSRFCADILNGKKDFELRHTVPKELERKWK